MKLNIIVLVAPFLVWYGDSFSVSSQIRKPFFRENTADVTFSRNVLLKSSWYDDSFTTTSRRTPVIAGNWKLNPETKGDAVNLLKLMASYFMNHRTVHAGGEDTPEVIVFPPFPFLSTASEITESPL